MSATIYQKHIEEKLKKIFVPQDVKREWSIWENSKDAWKRRSAYAPRLDLALGPFNLTATNKDRDIEIIKDAANNPLILETIQKGQADNQNWRYNANPRCLLAVEIEFSGSSKHILGDYTNASMMGYLGIVISSTHNYEMIMIL